MPTSRVPTAEVTADPAADASGAATSAKADLHTWYTESEASRILGVADRTFRENIQKKRWRIQKKQLPMKGRRQESRFNPEDVDRIQSESQAKDVMAFPVSSGVGAGGAVATSRRPGNELLAVVEHLASISTAAMAMVERASAAAKKPEIAERGPWLTVKEASAACGLSRAMVRRIVAHLLEQGSPDVVVDRAIKIRRAALEGFDGLMLRALPRPGKAANAAAAVSRSAGTDRAW